MAYWQCLLCTFWLHVHETALLLAFEKLWAGSNKCFSLHEFCPVAPVRRGTKGTEWLLKGVWCILSFSLLCVSLVSSTGLCLNGIYPFTNNYYHSIQALPPVLMPKDFHMHITLFLKLVFWIVFLTMLLCSYYLVFLRSLHIYVGSLASLAT